MWGQAFGIGMTVAGYRYISFTEAEQYESINTDFQDEVYRPSSAASPLPINQHSQPGNQEMQQSEHDVSPMVNSEYRQSDSNHVFPKIPNQDLGVPDIPHSIPNPSDSLMQTISEQAGPGLFLDICAGVNRPLSSAIMQAGVSLYL